MALVWNFRTPAYPIYDALYAVSAKFCPKFKGFTSGTKKVDASAYDDFFAARAEMRTFENDAVYEGADAFVGRTLSSSYALRPEEELYDRFVDALREVYFKYEENGRVKVGQETVLYFGGV